MLNKRGGWKKFQKLINGEVPIRAWRVEKVSKINKRASLFIRQVRRSRFGQKSSLFKYQKNYTSKSKASFQYLWVRTAHEKILRVCFRRENFLFDIEGYPFGFPKIFQIQRGDPSMSNKKFSLGKHTLKIFS